MTGVHETNPLEDPKAYHQIRRDQRVYWTAPGLKITRFRLLSDPGLPFWDVSYCDGELNGAPVRVQLPFHQLPKRGMFRAIVAAAKEDGLYAKGTGIFDALSTLV
jgi:hypothetical protein